MTSQDSHGVMAEDFEIPSVVEGRAGLVPSTELRALTCLIDAGQGVAKAADARAAMHAVLEALERHRRVLRGAVTLLNRETGKIHIEAAINISTEGQRARYELGEGITGRVVESGRPIVVPQISEEPLFLNRAVQRKPRAQQELSYVCVPILLRKR